MEFSLSAVEITSACKPLTQMLFDSGFGGRGVAEISGVEMEIVACG